MGEDIFEIIWEVAETIEEVKEEEKTKEVRTTDGGNTSRLVERARITIRKQYWKSRFTLLGKERPG